MFVDNFGGWLMEDGSSIYTGVGLSVSVNIIVLSTVARPEHV